MNFRSISSIPIVDLSEISSQLTIDEMNNVRLLKQKEKENYEKKLLERSREIKDSNIKEIKSEGKELLINKLRLLLSQKYNLSLNDYIIIIDKFKLESNNIDRTNVIDLISYLNTQSNYSKQSIDLGSNNNDTIDKSIINNLDLEKKFEIMERERNEMIRNIINNENTTKSDIINISDSNENNIVVNSEKENIAQNNIENTIKENIVLDISQKTRDKFDIKSKISNIEKPFINTKKTDILLINLLDYEINGNFSVTIDYNGKSIIEKIEKIEFIACNTNKNFCDKNGLSKKPHFIIRIEEFDNNFYVNGNNLNGFCPVLLEKKNSIYSYMNTEQLFGIFKPSSDFSLEKMTISIMDLSGTKLQDLKYTDNDQFNIMLKIERIID